MRTAVICIAKLENNYIREWVEHYKSIGFTNVIIADNNDIDGEKISSPINDYIASKFAIVEDFRGKHNIQTAAYTHLYKKYRTKYDWIAFFDIDEFLVIENSNINSFLLNPKFNNYDQIRFCWKLYDDNNILDVENNDYSVMNRFTHPVETSTRNNQCKSIIRCTFDASYINCHGIYGNIKSCNAIGNKCNSKDHFIGDCGVIHEAAWVNHYICKSIGEFLKTKFIRGDATHHPNKNNLQYFFTISKYSKEKELYGKNIIQSILKK